VPLSEPEVIEDEEGWDTTSTLSTEMASEPDDNHAVDDAKLQITLEEHYETHTIGNPSRISCL
jgi:hypothetical protein